MLILLQWNCCYNAYSVAMELLLQCLFCCIGIVVTMLILLQWNCFSSGIVLNYNGAVLTMLTLLQWNFLSMFTLLQWNCSNNAYFFAKELF